MYTNLRNNGKDLVLKSQDSFDPQMIFECGQAFNWTREEDGSYTTTHDSKVLNIKKSDDDIVFKNTNIDDFNNIWADYFDLDTDYSKIKDIVNIDEIMNRCIEYGYGIRILNQDPFETIISFIISANNRIPMIKKSISLLSKHYGEFIENYNGKDYYSFPSAEVLSQISPEEIREICRVGFRDKRIVETAKIIYESDININTIDNLNREELKELLMKLPGVGPKVSDCILLFAYRKKDAFPVDVWIKRVMETLYLNGEEMKNNEVADLGRKKFKDYAGVAQQYLFYYGRENSIGK